MAKIRSDQVRWDIYPGTYFFRTFRMKQPDGQYVDLSTYSSFRINIPVKVSGTTTTRSFRCTLVTTGEDADIAVTIEMFAATASGIEAQYTSVNIDSGTYAFSFVGVPISGGESKATAIFSGHIVVK